MKALTVRHNKYYTSILINIINKATLLEASQLRTELPDEYIVIKPTKRAMEQYRKEYREEELMRNTKVGDSFEIMGVRFKVLEQKPDSRVNGNIELSCTDYLCGKKMEEPTVMGIFYFQSLIEDVFHILTKGDMLYF